MKAIIRIWDERTSSTYRYRTNIEGPSDYNPTALIATLRAIADEIEDEYVTVPRIQNALGIDQ